LRQDGIELHRFYLGLGHIRKGLIFGDLVAWLVKWLKESHYFKVLLQ